MPPLNFSIAKTGLAFSAASLSYALVAPLAGGLDDHVHGRYGVHMQAVGALLISIGYAFLGPLELKIGSHMFQGRPSMVWAGMMLLGVGVGLGFSPVLAQIRHSALHEVVQERDVAAGTVFSLALSVGVFVGPLLGGFLAGNMRIQTAFTSFAALLLALAITLFSFACMRACAFDRRSADPLLVADDAQVSV
jgi:MFS family permease